MSKPRSRKAAGTASNFTAGVEDDESSSAAGAPSAIASSSDAPAPIVGVSTPAPADPGHGDATPTQHPGFAMSDDEAIPEQFLRPRSSPDGEAPASGRPSSAVPSVPRQSGPVVYEHRIRVLEAFHYEGQVINAPEWVGRDWVAYGDYDERRKLPAGPALNVPTPRSPYGATLCRKGDYIVKQEILLAAGLPPSVQIEVWEKEDFERLFIPIPQATEEAA